MHDDPASMRNSILALMGKPCNGQSLERRVAVLETLQQQEERRAVVGLLGWGADVVKRVLPTLFTTPRQPSAPAIGHSRSAPPGY